VPGLRVPHPGIAERSFVIYPLAEVAPGLVVPGLGAVTELCARCPSDGLERLS
jgi:2-amino-4-hydroxy-6-hydroxymethyldihydropteridine diphosphokinase